MEAVETILEPGQPRLELTPDAFLPGQAELSRFKEDYRRTQRNGQNVYVLIADSNQFISNDEFKQLKTRKESDLPVNSDSSNSKQFLGGGKVLSQTEADELYEPLVAALSDGFGYIDKLLWMRYPEIDEMPVWSNTTDKEDQKMAKLMLQRGQKSPAAAAVVRTIVDANDYVTVGMMFVPRIQMTAKLEREHRRLVAAAGNKQKLTVFRRADHEA